ncbi:MAG: hypothetical protein KatS3mg009_0377 [Acidimicrobiia bacterium]|nr:MAG: hypothetical protein KatS3mg009_0377 [Acidimicrobiia bacterium]
MSGRGRVERHLGVDRAAFVAMLRDRDRDPDGDRRAGSARPDLLAPRPGSLTAVLGPRLPATRLGHDLAGASEPRPLLLVGRADGRPAAAAAAVLAAARRAARGRAVVVVTAEPAIARLADRVVVVDGRAPVADGPPAAVLDDALAATRRDRC